MPAKKSPMKKKEMPKGKKPMIVAAKIEKKKGKK